MMRIVARISAEKMKKRFDGEDPRVTDLVGGVGGAAENKRSHQDLKIQEQGGE